MCVGGGGCGGEGRSLLPRGGQVCSRSYSSAFIPPTHTHNPPPPPHTHTPHTPQTTPTQQYLEQVRQHMSRLPGIDPSGRTLLLCGYPNVGKSSLMNKLTRADVEVQPYACTTKALYVGHADYKYLRWQVCLGVAGGAVCCGLWVVGVCGCG